LTFSRAGIWRRTGQRTQQHVFNDLKGSSIVKALIFFSQFLPEIERQIHPDRWCHFIAGGPKKIEVKKLLFSVSHTQGINCT
jgi:hypothetical protein